MIEYDLPKCYYERENIKQKENIDVDYFFISYSHKDKDKVYPILTALYDAGINFWYDKGLDVGDVWDEQVKKYIVRASCVGCLFFFSQNSLTSQAVYKEIATAVDKLNQSSLFAVVPIMINIDSYEGCINCIQTGCLGNIMEVMKINDNFKKLMQVEDYQIKRIYSNYNDENLIVKINKIAVELSATNTCGPKNFMKLKKQISKVNDDIIFTWGRYSNANKDKKDTIEWILYDKKDNKVFFITKYAYIVSDRQFIKNKTITNDMAPISNDLALVFDSKPYICNFSVLTTDVIENYKINESLFSNEADALREQKLKVFWVYNNKTKEYDLYNCNNCKINGINKADYLQITAGIRYIMEINDDKVGNY